MTTTGSGTGLSWKINSSFTNFLLIFTIIFVLIETGLHILLKYFCLQSEIVEEIIESIIIPPSEFRYITLKSEQIASIYIWNRSLCYLTTIKTLVFVVFFQRLFNRSYRIFVNLLIDALPAYMATKISGNANEGIRNYLIKYYLRNWRSFHNKYGELDVPF